MNQFCENTLRVSDMLENTSDNTGVLVDFDGTITQCDTFFGYFLQRMKQEPIRGVALLALTPILVMLWLVPLSRRIAVSVPLWICTVGLAPKKTVRNFQEYGTHIVSSCLCRESIVNRLRLHLQMGHHICVISASPTIWIRQVLNDLGLEGITVIGSRLKFCSSGLVIYRRCAGYEKVLAPSYQVK
jgi:phosphoserine phosphatase